MGNCALPEPAGPLAASAVLLLDSEAADTLRQLRVRLRAIVPIRQIIRVSVGELVG